RVTCVAGIDERSLATIVTLSGDASFGELHTAQIGTVTEDGTLTITGANTGDDITIGSMDGTFEAVHLTNITITDLTGTLTGDLRSEEPRVGQLERGTRT